jgi:hypothetical protein
MVLRSSILSRVCVGEDEKREVRGPAGRYIRLLASQRR